MVLCRVTLVCLGVPDGVVLCRVTFACICVRNVSVDSLRKIGTYTGESHGGMVSSFAVTFVRLSWKEIRMGLDVNASCLLCEIQESSCLKA